MAYFSFYISDPNSIAIWQGGRVFYFDKTSAHTSQKFQHFDISFMNFDLVFVTRWF